MDSEKKTATSSSVSNFSNAAGRSGRLVEIGEASESSDEGESEVFHSRGRKKSLGRNGPTAHGETSAIDTTSPFLSVTPTSPSITIVSQEFPVRPVQCRSLLESNLALGKNLHEMAGLPYAVAMKEVDNVTLELVRGQELMDDVLRSLEQVGTGLQNIQRDADLLRARCHSILPRAPPRPKYESFAKGASKLPG